MSQGVVLVDTIQTCAHITNQLMGHQELAMDVEGIDLCRTGSIVLIQLCTSSGQVILFDIAAMGQDAFDIGGLRAVLQSEQICKVLYDGRADADALYHRHRVEIRHAYDLQVQHALRYSRDNDRYVKGLQKCLSDAGVVPIMEQARLERLKDAGRKLFAPDHGGRYAVWMERPLRQALVDYAAADVKYLIPVKAAWRGSSSQAVFRVTRDRLKGAVNASVPAKGQHMSERDFSLGLNARYLGRAAVEKPRCFQCGSSGHLARSCPNRTGLRGFNDLDDLFDDFDRRTSFDDYDYDDGPHGFADFAPDGYIDSSGNEW
eukprot:Skav230550  [mRNA]  locus=scaffold1605:49164:50114:- [translate_table: standard]